MNPGPARVAILGSLLLTACSTTNVTNVYEMVTDGGDAGGSMSDGGDATIGVDAPADASADVSDAGSPEASDAGTDCSEVFPPAKPAGDDPSDAGNQTFIVAMHTLDLGIRADGGTPPLYGYDLDHVFTGCNGGAESCSAVVAGATHADETGGRDNSGGQLISSLALLDPTQLNSDTISQRLQNGVYSLVLQIEGYNGQANDTQVVAALYSSDGVQGSGDAGASAKWDGTDVWTVDSEFVLGGSDASAIMPNHYDAHAYVSGGILVMQVDFPVSLGATPTGAILVSLTGGVITGQITPVPGGTFRLSNGQIAGRWTVPSVLASIQSLTLAGQSICPGTSLYTNVKQQICSAVDIETNPANDNTGAVCDAVSIGFGFTADPALVGSVVSSSATIGPCDGGADAAPNDCTTP